MNINWQKIKIYTWDLYHLYPNKSKAFIVAIIVLFFIFISSYFFKKHKFKIQLFVFLSVILMGYVGYKFILSYIKNLQKTTVETLENLNKNYIFGIDISHYNGTINWEQIKASKFPIQFVFIRSSMGKNGVDKQFNINYTKAKEAGYLVGVYHYYRPNENSTQQFNHFNSVYTYKKGDLPPVLDIEEMGKNGEENLRKGLLNFLQLIKKNWGIKPIIYSGRTFYFSYIKDYFNNYPLWIAAYSGEQRVNLITWEFYQFTEQLQIKGIQSAVDGNYYKGNLQDLKKMCR
jgi:lysozyme